MNYLYNRYRTLRTIIDIPIFILSYIIAVLLFKETYTNENIAFNKWFALLALACWYSSAFLSNLYTDRRSNRFSEEIIFIIYTFILFTILLAGISFFFAIYIAHSILFFAFFNVLFFLSQVIIKYYIRRKLQFAFLKSTSFDNILLIGSTDAAKEFHETINIHFYYGYKCAGLLGDEKMEWEDCPYLGKIDQLAEVLQQYQIDEVLITLPNNRDSDIKTCIETCDLYGIRTRIIADVYQYSTNVSRIEYIGLIPVIKLRNLPLDDNKNKLIKKVFDLSFSLVFMLLIGIWLFPLIAILIKLNSKGPVLFKQERWGLNNKKIILYKFRTMIHKCPEMDKDGKFLPTVKNDKRITLIGKYLRRTSFDELPQFWNILIGNMSLVGPRPHATPMNLESMQNVENYLLRHLVKPGLTGWAQVNGSRGEVNGPGAMERRVRFDLYYISKWTFWLDCQIIIQTIIKIIKGDENAF